MTNVAEGNGIRPAMVDGRTQSVLGDRAKLARAKPDLQSRPVVELLCRPRSGRAQRLLCVLLLIDEGNNGVEIGRDTLAALVRCDRTTLNRSIADLVAEGLLDVMTPAYSPAMGIQASTYRLMLAGMGQVPSLPTATLLTLEEDAYDDDDA